MNMFDGTIWHQQAIFKIKIFPCPRRALDGLFHERQVFRMNPLESELHSRYRGSVVLEDSKAFIGPDELAGGGSPDEAPGMTEPLSLRQVRLASLLSALTCHENTACILQGNRSQQLFLVVVGGH